MTQVARDSRDKPFSDWLRKNPELDSIQQSLDVTDIDFVFHKYRTHTDRIGTREVKLMLEVEVKTWGKELSPNQAETLFFRHQLLNKYRNLRSKKGPRAVWHLGQYVLILSGGERPDSCDTIGWGLFNHTGNLTFTLISEKKLVKILRFDIYPDNFKEITLRRHHLTKELGFEDHTGLFPLTRFVKQRS